MCYILLFFIPFLLDLTTSSIARPGVSAVPTGAFAARFARASPKQNLFELLFFLLLVPCRAFCDSIVQVNWVSPHLDKKAEHHDILLESLAHCPFFVAPCHALPQRQQKHSPPTAPRP